MPQLQLRIPPRNLLLTLVPCVLILALTLALAACGGGDNGGSDFTADPGTHPAAAAAQQMYHHMAAGDFTAAAGMLSDESIATLGGLDAAAERLKASNPAMIHHGGISSMSSTVSAQEDLGVMVKTNVIFKDGTLDEMKAWMQQYDGVWKMNV